MRIDLAPHPTLPHSVGRLHRPPGRAAAASLDAGPQLPDTLGHLGDGTHLVQRVRLLPAPDEPLAHPMPLACRADRVDPGDRADRSAPGLHPGVQTGTARSEPGR
ncbi:hypothetical protein [Kitasatospora sp. NPDC059571]|uniref:hypothetical protein n=1 Tax=Kitasatospora sp. NPDC059571 TaxID=3346871 RepID=UPI0036AD62E0